MSDRWISAVEAAAVVVFGLVVAWWLAVYLQVSLRTGMPFEQSVPCFFFTSDRCSLAMALCTDWHFLGIKRYFAGAAWIAFAFLIGAYVVGRSSRD